MLKSPNIIVYFPFSSLCLTHLILKSVIKHIQLALEQHGFELCGSTNNRDFFFFLINAAVLHDPNESMDLGIC